MLCRQVANYEAVSLTSLLIACILLVLLQSRHNYADLDANSEVTTAKLGSSGESNWSDLSHGVVVDIDGTGHELEKEKEKAIEVDVKVLNEKFHKALHCSTNLLSGVGESMKVSVAGESVKLELYGYFKQAKEGDYIEPTPIHIKRPIAEGGGEEDTVRKMKIEAWKTSKGMSEVSAKQKYIELLSVISPGWENRG